MLICTARIQHIDNCRMFYRKMKMVPLTITFLQNFSQRDFLTNIKTLCLVEQNKGLIGGKRHSAKLTECSLNIACMLNVWKFIILQIYMISLRWFRSFSHFLTIYPNDKYGWLIKKRRKLKNIEDKSASYLLHKTLTEKVRKTDFAETKMAYISQRTSYV